MKQSRNHLHEYLNDAISLDETYDDGDGQPLSLLDSLSDPEAPDMLSIVTAGRDYERLFARLEERLTLMELRIWRSWRACNDGSLTSVAKDLEINVKQVDNTMSRLRLKLKKMVEEEGGIDRSVSL